VIRRTLSTFALWALVLSLAWWGGAPALAAFVAVVGLLTQWEFYVLARRGGIDVLESSGMLSGVLVLFGPFFLPSRLPDTVPLALGVVFCALEVLRRAPPTRVPVLLWTLAGLVYAAFMLHFPVRLLAGPELPGAMAIACFVWTVGVAKFCDVGALLGGMAFGRRAMAPQISPKKTWEGAAAGVVTSVAVGVGSVALAREYFPDWFTPVVAGLLAAPLAVLAIVGDLIESVFKRHAGAKDAGGAIPGIGGVFDMTDSLILVAPVAYACFVLGSAP
jgi:phosphatidate cytidylyltransferase